MFYYGFKVRMVDVLYVAEDINAQMYIMVDGGRYMWMYICVT